MRQRKIRQHESDIGYAQLPGEQLRKRKKVERLLKIGERERVSSVDAVGVEVKFS